MKTQSSLTVLLAGLFCVFCESARAELSGDFRNTTVNIAKGTDGDMTLNVQQDNGQAVAVGGVTVKSGDTVSFDSRGILKTKTAGFWKGTTANGFGISGIAGPQGNTIAIIHVLAGTVRWNADRNVTEGLDRFATIETAAAPNRRLSITQRAINDGTLFITAEDGSKYKVYDLSVAFTATIERVPSSTDITSATSTSAGAPKTEEKAGASVTTPLPSVDQIAKDLDKKEVIFKNGFFMLRPGDSMGLSGAKVRNIRVGKSNEEGNTLTLSIDFEFVVMQLGGQDQWKPATGTMVYTVQNGSFRCLTFSGTTSF